MQAKRHLSKKTLPSLIGALAIVAFTAVSAEERVVEERWILSDPTVAKIGDYVLGASIDYHYFSNPYQDNYGSTQTYSGSTDGSRLGGSLVAGYGDTTFMLSFKKGDYSWNETGGPGNFDNYDGDYTQYEARLRYLLREQSFLGVVPYLLLNFTRTKIEGTNETNFPFEETGTNVYENELIINAYTIGSGIIWPLTESFGIRADLNVGYAFTSEDVKNAAPGQISEYDDSGFAAFGTATAYYDFSGGFNLQVGMRGDLYALDDGDEGGYGAYVQLGYSHRF